MSHCIEDYWIVEAEVEVVAKNDSAMMVNHASHRSNAAFQSRVFGFPLAQVLAKRG